MKNPLKFIQDVKQEAFKVTWPTGKETLQGTLMVVAMAIIASIFFLLMDQIFKFLLEISKEFKKSSIIGKSKLVSNLYFFIKSDPELIT